MIGLIEECGLDWCKTGQAFLPETRVSDITTNISLKIFFKIFYDDNK